MRADVDSWEIEDYRFVMELDTGGDPDLPYTLWIYKDKEPLRDVDGYQIRREFKKNYNKRHVQNFCMKFVNNEEYRSNYLNPNKKADATNID